VKYSTILEDFHGRAIACGPFRPHGAHPRAHLVDAPFVGSGIITSEV